MIQLIDMQSEIGTEGIESWPNWIRLNIFGRKKMLLYIRQMRAGIRAPIPYFHFHIPADIYSYIQYDNNSMHEIYIRSYIYSYIYQMQLISISYSPEKLVDSPRHLVSRIYILLNISSYIAGRYYPNNISFISRLNHICGCLRSYNFIIIGIRLISRWIL